MTEQNGHDHGGEPAAEDGPDQQETATPKPGPTHPADRPRTYSQWLTSTANTGRRDVVGVLARTWKQTEGSRPRRSGIAGLTRWFTDPENLPAISERSARPLSAAEVGEAAHAAAREYRAAQVAERGLVAGLPGTGLPPRPGQQQRDQAAESTGEVLSVIYGQLSRIEGTLIEAMAVLREQAAQAADRDGKLDRVLAWQAEQDLRLGPINALLAELAAAEAQPDGDLEAGDDGSEGYARAVSDAQAAADDPPYQDRGLNAYGHIEHPWASPDADVAGDIAAIGRLPSGVEGAQQPDTSDMPGSSPTPYMGTLSGENARLALGLPKAISDMPPGQQRDQAAAAFREVYPGPRQPGPPAEERPSFWDLPGDAEAGPAAHGTPRQQPGRAIGSPLYGGHEQ